MKARVIIGVALVAMIITEPAFAQAALHDASGSMSGLLELIKDSSDKWAIRLEGYATRLFWILAVIQLVWTFFPLVMRQADFGEIAGELIRFIMVIGFFAALLLNVTVWAEAIISSFRQAGASAAGVGVGLKPGDIFGLAIELGDTMGDVQTINPLTAVMVALAGTIVVLCFSFIAAFVGLTLIESYIVINASVLFMGFGGSQWTRDYAISMLRYAVSVGAKLFVLTLIVGLIMQSARQWQIAYNHDDASMWTMVGLGLVCAYLSKTIPDLIQGLITGVSISGGAPIGGMAAAGVAGATAAMAAMSATATTGQGAGESSSSGGLTGLINSSFGLGDGSSAPSKAPGLHTEMSTLNPSPSASSGVGASRVGGGVLPPPTSAPKGQGEGLGSTVGVGLNKAVTTAKVAANPLNIASTLSAISVPGMEGSAGTTIGVPPPPPPAFDEQESFNSSPTQENIIRPSEGEVPQAAQPTPSVKEEP